MIRKIAYITDIHLDEQFPKNHNVDTRKNWKLLLKDITEKGINEIVIGGDFGEKSSNKWFFESLNTYKIAISLGNHDYYNEVVKHYNFENAEKQTELYYSQEKDFYKFIFLDSSSGTISEEQFNWFKKELVSTKKIILFIHHPVLKVNTEVDKRYPLINRDRLKIELLNLKNDITIFCGHYHFEDEQTNKNIKQYITPACSFQVEKIPDEIKINNTLFGYRIIELNQKEIKTKLVLFP